MNRRMFAVALLVILVSVRAQPEGDPEGEWEDFERFPLGDLPPEGDWWSAVAFGTSVDVDVEEPGLNGTTKKIHFLFSEGGLDFELIPELVNQHTSFSFYWESGTLTTSPVAMRVEFIDDDIGNVYSFSITSDTEDFQVAEAIPCPGIQLFPNNPTVSKRFRVDFDWTELQASVFADGVVSSNSPRAFCNEDVTKIDTVRFRTGGSGVTRDFVDEFILSEGPTEEEEDLEPTEFDAGFIRAVNAIGFRTPESQMLLVIIIVSIATIGIGAAMSWFNSGKSKNYSVLGIPAALCIFFIVAGFLDLWMFLLALIMGLTAVGAGGVAVNTYHELMAFAGGIQSRFRMGDEMAPDVERMEEADDDEP